MRIKSISQLLLAVLLTPTIVYAQQQGNHAIRFQDVPYADDVGQADGGDSIESILRQADSLPDPTSDPLEPEFGMEFGTERNESRESSSKRSVRSSKPSFSTLQTSVSSQPVGFDVRNPVDVEMTHSTVDSTGGSFTGPSLSDAHIGGAHGPYGQAVELDAFANNDPGNGYPSFAHGQVIHGPGTQMNDTAELFGSYDGMVDSYVQDLLQNGCSTTDCLPACGSITGPPIPTMCMPCSPDVGVTGWYAQAQALFLQPWGMERVETSVNAGGETVLATEGLHQSWATGIDARVGFRTGYSAIEFGWWSLFSDNDQATATSDPGDLFSIINFIELDVDFNNAHLHRLESEIELHTFELNKRHLLSGWNTGALRFAYMWGVRFTRLSDELRFLADLDNTTLGDPTGELGYEIEVDNRLFGPQIGGSIQWQISERLSAMLDAKAGLFYNNIDQSQFVFSSTGPATIVAGPDTGRLFDVDRNDHQASVLTELQINLDYTLTQRTRLLFGYRAFAASGVALSRSQVPWRFGSLQASEVDASDSLMLHGFQLGFDASF